MIRRSGALALLVFALAVVPQTAAAKSIKVNVRVEGAHKTLFEGNIKTAVHKVNGHDKTGKHRCDGTNGGATTTPAPTVTGAFDNASRQSKLTWHGKWFSSFEDFLIDRVGPDSNTKTKFWNLELNWQDLQNGGCHTKVHKGDYVLVSYNGFGKPLLKLTGPTHAHTGKAFTVKIVNGRDGTPVQGAKLRGHKTNANGKVKLVVNQTGTVRLKARKPGTIRSNELDVAVGP
jgi:hypothetical protein